MQQTRTRLFGWPGLARALPSALSLPSALTLPLALALAVGLGARSADATPRMLPYTYGYETLGEGEVEIEQYVDLTPLKALSTSTGQPAWYAATQFQTEIETGISDRLELGLYVTFVPRPGDGLDAVATLPGGNGVKQRLRLRLAEEGDLPVDIALYGEVGENEREVELEAKVILQKRFGPLKLAANLWGERELYYDGRAEWVAAPTAGLSYEVTPAFHPGIEGWLWAEYPTPAPATRGFNLGPHTFVGPTALVSVGQMWWSTGVYLRLNDLGATPELGDSFGNLWLRTVVGIEL